jgi:hypothetical protein
MKRSFALLTVAVALTLMAAAPRAVAQDATPRSAKVGYLSCHVASGFGIIIASSRDLACTFTSANGKAVENYTGEISKFGADIGYLQSGVILMGGGSPCEYHGTRRTRGSLRWRHCERNCGARRRSQCPGGRSARLDRATADLDRGQHGSQRRGWRRHDEPGICDVEVSFDTLRAARRAVIGDCPPLVVLAID